MLSPEVDYAPRVAFDTEARIPTSLVAERGKRLLDQRWHGDAYTLAHRFSYEIHSYFDPDEATRVGVALNLVLDKFDGKLRGSGSPKGLHSVDVALIMMGFLIKDSLKPIDSTDSASLSLREGILGESVFPKFDKTLKIPANDIIAGLLHDVVEEELDTIDNIELLFGEDVADKVGYVTYLKSKNLSSSQLRAIATMVLQTDPSAFNIKIADIKSNTGTISDLKGKSGKQGNVIETAADQQRRKSLEYFEFVPIILELRHFCSDFICDELFKRVDPSSYFDILSLMQEQKEEYLLHHQLYKEFASKLSDTLPDSPFSIRFEIPSIYRVFERMSKHGFSKDKAFAATFFLIPQTGEVFSNVKDFIEKFSFDRGVSEQSTTESTVNNLSEKSDFLIRMASGSSLRLVLSNQKDHWMHELFAQVCYGGDESLMSQFKERYGLFFKMFGEEPDLGKIGESSGRNQSKVFISMPELDTFPILVPRGSTIFDVWVQVCGLLGQEVEGFPSFEMKDSGHPFPLEPQQIVFARQNLSIDTSKINPMSPFYGLYSNCRLTKSREYLREMANARILLGSRDIEDELIVFDGFKQNILPKRLKPSIIRRRV